MDGESGTLAYRFGNAALTHTPPLSLWVSSALAVEEGFAVLSRKERKDNRDDSTGT